MNLEFEKVVQNALNFLEVSVRDMESEHSKYAVINFYSGLELFLKARLLAENWKLCVVKSDQVTEEEFAEGRFQSIGLNEAKKRLENFAGGKIDASEGSVYETLRRRRNQAVHFYHPELLGPVAKVAVEQLIGWKLLFRRLTVAWKQQFSKFSEPLDALNSRIIRREDYFPGVFQHLIPSITEESKTKPLAKCRSCGQFSSLAEQEIFTGLLWMHCAVCEAEQATVFLPCRGNSCSDLAERSYTDEVPCRHCGLEHQAETAESFSFYQQGLPGFELIGWCGVCGYTPRQSLIEQGNQVFCLACHHLLDRRHFSRCEWCNSDVTGPIGNALNPGCVRCGYYIVYEEGQELAPEYLNDPEEWPKILEMISWS